MWMVDLVLWPDGSHGAARYFALLLNTMSLKAFWLLMTCVWIFPYGHDRHADGQFYQLRCCTKDFFNNNTPEGSVLWQVFGGHIHNELKALGVDLPGERPRNVEPFDHMRQNPQEKGSNTSFGRFLAVVSTPMKRLPRWHADTFERTFLGLEIDAMRSGKFKHAITLPSSHSGLGIDVPE